MTGRTVISNFVWRFAERCGAQIVQLVVSIVLARLLLPSDYGTVALMTVFIGIMSFTLPTAIALYWITSSSFTVFQNLTMKRGKKA